jgi:hypothetical protein
MHHKYTYPIIAAVLFIILSSKPVYSITNSLIPGVETQRYGAPTRFGLVLHGVVFSILFVLLRKFFQ